MGQGTSYGYYEEAEGRSDNAHRQPIPVSDAHGCWTAAMPNFLELRYGEDRRIPLPRTPVNKGETNAGDLL
jgi:hypothetical protein